MKITYLKPEYVDVIPESLKEGVIYVSRQYKTAMHKCCCGCGKEVVTPLIPTEWAIKTEDDGVTLYPSVGNWGFPCKSHYWIKKNQVIDAGPMSQFWIDRGRLFDKKAKESYYRGKGKKETVDKIHQPQPVHPIKQRISLWRRIIEFFKG